MVLRAIVNMQNRINNLVRKDEGQDLLEYALLVALIALVAIGAVTAAGVKVDAVFQAISEAIPVV
jgi:pilus assembly protein Flp/PilA